MIKGERKRNPADVSVRESRIHGQGVIARKGFLKGEPILAIDDSDPVVDRSKLTPEQEIFIDVFVASDGTQKTTWMKSPERFINHSCEPNAYVVTDMRSGVRRTRALRDIRVGEELTWDYALNIWAEWIGPVPCHCGAEKCRRVIQGNYFTLPREIQRRYLPLLDGPFKKRFRNEIQSLNLTAKPDAD
ncbi:MAG: SET domain-containing protein-lysine N-methyltransferase [Thermoplasmata archaeon]|nr:SET domain-containing protein-lysine N-methyltransferase [Thermoplasmata archaeon]